MSKILPVTLLAACFSASADTEIHYDSQGFENLGTAFTSSSYPDVSIQGLNTLHPSTPQPYELFAGSTLETILLNNTHYIDLGTGGIHSIGLIGSPIGTPIYNPAGTQVTTNYDALSLNLNTLVCQNIESVTVEFDLSLAALYGTGPNPNRLYFPDTMFAGTPVAPMVNVKLFDEQNINIDFNTELQSSIVTGVRVDNTRQHPFSMEWSHHTVTLPLTATDLIGNNALLTISGAGSATANENTYVALDNVIVSLNTPAGEACASVGQARAIPATNSHALASLLVLLSLSIGFVFYYRKRIK